ARIGIEVVNDQVTVSSWWCRSGPAIRFVDRAADRAGECGRATRDDREAVEEAECVPAGFRLVRVRWRGLLELDVGVECRREEELGDMVRTGEVDLGEGDPGQPSRREGLLLRPLVLEDEVQRDRARGWCTGQSGGGNRRLVPGSEHLGRC